MNSPIFLEWAATQPPRETLPARHGRPLLVLAGIVAVLAAAVSIWHELEPLVTFRPVTATIVRADVASVPAGSRAESARTLATRGSRIAFVPDVDYRYVVDGREWFGAYFRRGAMLEQQSESKRRLANGSPGRTVTAWYNPWQPQDAVLDRTPNRAGLAVCAAIALFGVLLILAGNPPRGLRERPAESIEKVTLRKSA